MKYLFLPALIFLGFTVCKAQNIPLPPDYANKLKIEAAQTNDKIVLDGKLTEADWNRSGFVKKFKQAYPLQGKDASFDTEVKVLYDSRNIYIGAICHNPGNKIFVQDLRRDFVYSNNELFGVFFDPFQDVQNPVPSFLVTPYGTQRDLLIYDDRIYDLNWDAVWEAKSFITDSSWSTEIAIPWSTLRYPSDSTTWGINFNRNIRSLNEITGWSPWPMAYTVGRMSYAGLVTNLHPPKNKDNIRVQPYTLLNTKKTEGKKASIKPQVGGELKWLLNTNTSVEATVNTDFAQADADRQVVNLNHSSVFFPEKRQFFLENANLFAIGQDEIIQPFFSRRIGLDSLGNPLRINAGMRFIHQTGERAVGALVINQSDKDTSTNSWFGVIRAQQNISTKARIGAMATFRYDELDHTSNTIASVDGFWQASEPLYIRPMLSMALPSGNAKSGWAFFNEVAYVKNKFSVKWYETMVTKNYQPKTGFLARTDFIHTHPELLITLPVRWFRQNKTGFFIPGLKADIYHNATTKAWQETNIVFTPFQVTTPKGTTVAINLLPSWQKLSDVFDPVPHIFINPGKYAYTRINFNLSTNLSAPFSFLSDITLGKFYNGYLNSYTVGIRYVPVPNIAATINYTRNNFYDFGSAKTSTTTHLLAPELRVSFTPKIQLSGFYQYNTVNNLGGLNMRFSWEFKPLSFAYLVFNNLKTIDSKLTATPVNDQSGILKISYIRQL